jgi:foldase protein PrsA
MIVEFQNAAFAMKVGEISKPVESPAGFHIIQVLGHENRAVSGADFQKYKDQTFLDFLKKLRDASKVEEYDLWKEVVPIEPALPTVQPK